jgi:hypothetical protein
LSNAFTPAAGNGAEPERFASRERLSLCGVAADEDGEVYGDEYAEPASGTRAGALEALVISGLGLSVADDGELSTGEAVATGSRDDSSVDVAGESGGPPPSADVSLAPVGNPLDVRGVDADVRGAPAASRRVEAGSIMGVESPVLAPAPVAELDESESQAPVGVGRLLDGTT